MNNIKYYRELPNGEIHTMIIKVTQHVQEIGEKRNRPYVSEADFYAKKKGYSRNKSIRTN